MHSLSILDSKRIKSATVVVLALIISLFAFGCAAPSANQSQDSSSDSSSAEEAQPLTSREYMSQMNTMVEELNEGLQGFNDAVAREDPITMKTQAENAFAVMDEMASIQPPEQLNELHEKYITACDKLKMALNAYINLYSEISSATEQNPFDYSTYSDRLAQIQNQYNLAIEELEDADELAKSL